jgi:hypothetical protein
MTVLLAASRDVSCDSVMEENIHSSSFASDPVPAEERALTVLQKRRVDQSHAHDPYVLLGTSIANRDG